MKISPTGALMVVTNAAYGHPAEPQERKAGVGQSIYIGPQTKFTRTSWSRGSINPRIVAEGLDQ